MISLGMLLILAVLFVATTTAKEEVVRDYIDLLDLPDNDEYLWGFRENKNASTYSLFHKKTDEQLTHSIRKRQASNVNDQTLPENKDYGTCRTPTGEIGHCRHIIYCRMPELKNDVWKVVSQLCIIKSSSIGICCPEYFPTRLGPEIITDVNDKGLGNGNGGRIVNHAEQRGCGITTKQFPRVTGGRPAEPDEWPWMAAILHPGLPYVWCGGVLISDRLVLTAAHCIDIEDKDSLVVRLGEYNTNVKNETRARDFRIAAMVKHLDYNYQTYENDIGLVRVNRPTLFNTYIWPVCLPPIGENWEGRTGLVTGWGAKNFAGPHSEILMEVPLPVWNHAECKNSMIERIPDTVICAGNKAGGQDSCQGDSGGPFLLQLPSNRWITIGIVSYGVRCGEPNRPGVYTRVDKYLHWIFQNSDI